MAQGNAQSAMAKVAKKECLRNPSVQNAAAPATARCAEARDARDVGIDVGVEMRNPAAAIVR